MRFVTRALVATALATTLVIPAGAQDPAATQGQDQEPRFDQEVEVIADTRAPRSRGDYLLTIDVPVSVSDVSLPPGQYMFRFPSTSSGNILQVATADLSTMHAMVHTSPVLRPRATNRHVLVLGAATAAGVRPIKAWFLPGRRQGRELVQP